MLGNILGGFIVIIVGVNLIGPVASAVERTIYVGGNHSRPTNVTGAAVPMLELITLFFAIGIVASGVAIATIGLRQSGLLDL